MYVIGETGILEELDLKGIQHMGGPEDATKVVTLKKGEYMEHDPEVCRLQDSRAGTLLHTVVMTTTTISSNVRHNGADRAAAQVWFDIAWYSC